MGDYPLRVQVQAPDRQLVFQALRARCNDEIRAGKMQAAESTRRDLDSLQKSSGDNLYEMHRNSSEKLRTLGYPYTNRWENGTYRDWLSWHPEIAIPSSLGGLLGGALLIGGVASGQVPVLAVGAGIFGGVVLGNVVLAKKLRARMENEAIVGAVERNQDYLRTYQPTQASTVSIERKVFLAGLAGQEQKLASGGQYALAGQMHRVHDRLAALPGQTADEVMEQLLANAQKGGDDREVLELVQGPCAQPIAESIKTLMEVSKLVAPGTLNTIQEGQDNIIIGGVVLKKAS